MGFFTTIMEIKIDIWRKNRIDKNFFIIKSFIFTEQDLEKFALQQYIDDYCIEYEDAYYEYSASISETKI